MDTPTDLILRDRRGAMIVSKDECGGANVARLSGQNFLRGARVPITGTAVEDHLES